MQCEGGYPCHSCISSGRSCKFEAAVQQSICFRHSAHGTSKCTLHPSRILTHQNENCIWQFFTSFLSRNDFTARPSDGQQILKSYIHKSAGLRNAIIAVGALDLSRHANYSPTAAAYYKQAVSSLRVQLSQNIDIDEATLWTSLLLAIFELMVDDTGTGFMLHFTKGLPALIRQRNFNCGETKCRQTLIHMIQMLEAMRSAPFWSNMEPTLLEDPLWQQMNQYTAGESSESQGFTILYNLMSRFLKWNNMVYAIVLAVLPEDMTFEDRQQLKLAARDGLDLYSQLEMWYIEHANRTETRTPLSLLSSIYHGATAVSISTIFDFPHFAHCGLLVPGSSTLNLNTKVDELCTLLRCALRTTNLAGILILWPLRVAGSKSIRKDQAHQILGMLREIRQQGFAVAQSFEHVLKEQWKQRVLL